MSICLRLLLIEFRETAYFRNSTIWPILYIVDEKFVYLIRSPGDNVMSPVSCCSIPPPDCEIDESQDDSDVRVEKILSIRQQLGEGRYYVFEKMDVIADWIIEGLLVESDSEDQ
jgi:hypothetical protein